ncbi:hypothetical protein H4R18_001267 [Coemansia javaensis]|uniref:AMP-dependent synthetase/ligase domain-containing protein n=1 Tax=Coemansia javaensis TaxID=2761396 RepID=A0A9W8HIN9_9FUNG|nr:hypothetical protein H4R18_001267 [Coemansia javaensis]
MVYESQLPPIDVPGVNVVEYVLGECRKRCEPGRAVFVDSDTGEALTLDGLEALTRGFARGLRASGIRPGDTVTVFAANSIYYPFVAYGILAAGAVCAPANPQYTPRELAHQIADSGCRAIVVGDGLGDTVAKALHLAGRAVDHVWALDESRTMCDGSVFRVADAAAAAAAAAGGGDGDGDDRIEPLADPVTAPAYLCYSSGTTGRPKGLILTHRNMVANAMQINAVKTLDVPGGAGPDTFLGLAPFCHAYGLSYVLHSSVSVGGKIVVMRRYSFERMLASIEAHRVTFAYLVPPIVCALSKDPRADDHSLDSMRTILSGGAALSPSLIRATEARLAGLRIIQGYGMSEMSPAVTMLATSHTRHESVGILMPSCQAKVIDDQGAELPAGAAGELCFRGPNVMLGYLNNAAATRDILGEDGFLHTGDVGYVDAEGFFYITDRKKELIKFKGFQVAPAELEALLAEHPYIEDAAVMPVYDPAQATELPRGYFVLRPQRIDSAMGNGGQASSVSDGDGDSGNVSEHDASCAKSSSGSDHARAQQVVEWLHERVAPFKRLRGGFAIVDRIPRSPAGKVIRGSLREMIQAAAAVTS